METILCVSCRVVSCRVLLYGYWYWYIGGRGGSGEKVESSLSYPFLTKKTSSNEECWYSLSLSLFLFLSFSLLFCVGVCGEKEVETKGCRVVIAYIRIMIMRMRMLMLLRSADDVVSSFSSSG